MLKDVSAEEDHFSDATEGIGDEETPATPVSTPLRFRLEADLEDDTPTPVNMSPRAAKVPQIIELPMEVASSGAEPMTPDTRRLSQEQDELIIPSTRNGMHEGAVRILVNQGDGIGVEFIEMPEKQGREEETETGDAMEQTLTQADNVFRSNSAKTTPDEFPCQGMEEEGQHFACEFGDDFDDFGEAVEGGDGFVDFEGFEEGTTINEIDAPDFAEVSQPAAALTPQSQPVIPLLPVVCTL